MGTKAPRSPSPTPKPFSAARQRGPRAGEIPRNIHFHPTFSFQLGEATGELSNLVLLGGLSLGRIFFFSCFILKNETFPLTLSASLVQLLLSG